jgi:molecular chaperone GrpE
MLQGGFILAEEDRVVSEGEASELAEDDVESLKEALVQEKEKAERYLANWQRTEADFRNYKAREEKEKKDLINWANSTLVCDILPVLDAFDQEGAEGVILDEFRKGYKLKDKLLRAPQVVVGKDSGTSAAEASEQDEEDLNREAE